MAISTYAQLQAAVAAWAHRTNLTSTIIDCIALCEAELNDRLLLKNMEFDEPLTLIPNQNYVALPAGFVSPIAAWIVIDTERTPLNFLLPEELSYKSDSSIPRYCAVDGENLRFDCPSDSAYGAFLRCVKASNLSDLNTTNYLLTKRPDVYLFGTLKQFALFTRDNEDMAKYSGLMEQSIAGLKAAENRSRSIAPLRTDFGGAHRYRSDIFTG